MLSLEEDYELDNDFERDEAPIDLKINIIGNGSPPKKDSIKKVLPRSEQKKQL